MKASRKLDWKRFGRSLAFDLGKEQALFWTVSLGDHHYEIQAVCKHQCPGQISSAPGSKNTINRVPMSKFCPGDVMLFMGERERDNCCTRM